MSKPQNDIRKAPPLVLKYKNVKIHKTMCNLRNKLSIERTGKTIDDLIVELSDKHGEYMGDKDDIYKLCELHMSGDIVNLSYAIANQTFAGTKWCGNAIPCEDLTVLLSSDIFYGLMEVIAETEMAVSEKTIKELANVLGLTPTDFPHKLKYYS